MPEASPDSPVAQWGTDLSKAHAVIDHHQRTPGGSAHICGHDRTGLTDGPAPRSSARGQGRATGG